MQTILRNADYTAQCLGTAQLIWALTEGGRHSSVGITNDYVLEGLAFEPCWKLDFPDQSRPAPMPIQPPVHRVPSPFAGSKAAGAWR